MFFKYVKNAIVYYKDLSLNRSSTKSNYWNIARSEYFGYIVLTSYRFYSRQIALFALLT